MRAASLLSVLAAATLSTANLHTTTSISHHNQARTTNLLCGLLGNLLGGCTSNYVSKTWQCSGSGTDGYSLDYNGKACPSTYPANFLWFGTNVGWAPPLGWKVPSTTWSPPSTFQASCAKATWWAPASSWVYPSSLLNSILPDLWAALNWHSYQGPAQGWQCDGESGTDGWSHDYNGNSAPSGYPAEWMYFGSDFGFLPAAGWNVPSDSWVAPSGCIDSLVSRATWWRPAYSWSYPDGIDIPCWWQTNDSEPDGTCGDSPAATTTDTPDAPEPTPTETSAPPASTNPSSTWECDGSGTDGFSTDPTGASCPYGDAFKWFGKTHKWQPAKSFAPTSWSSWSPNAAWLPTCGLASWWVPSHDWVYPSSLAIPSFWAAQGWTPYTWAPSDFSCSGSGTDGFGFDHSGSGCPYSGVSGFKWFGTSHGWQPAKGWKVPSNTWSPPSAWVPTCSKASWWAPASTWVYPSTLVIPSFWVSLGWSSYNWAPSSYICNGKGTDGYLFDHLGNGLPSGYSTGFKYYGIDRQWQPCSTFVVPSKTWVPPGSWSPKGATWWKPTTTWKVPSGYGCPTWWPTNLLQGIFSWL